MTNHLGTHVHHDGRTLLCVLGRFCRRDWIHH